MRLACCLFVFAFSLVTPRVQAQAHSPNAAQPDRCSAAALDADQRERTADLARADGIAAQAKAIHLRPPAFTLAAALPLLVGATLQVSTAEDPPGWTRALPVSAAVAVATSAGILIARGSSRARLRHEVDALRARASYLAELAQACATSPGEASQAANALALRALESRGALKAVETELARHRRLLPVSMLVTGAVSTLGLGIGALVIWNFQDGNYTDEQYFAPHERRMVIGFGAGAAAGLVLTIGGGIWTVLTMRARRALVPEQRRLRLEQKELSPALVPVAMAHGGGLMLTGRF